jgi:hypothetical protein
MAGSTVIVPKITGYAAFDPTAIAITGGNTWFTPSGGITSVPISLPADTNEDTFISITVPAMSANGGFEVRALFTCTNNANAKTLKAYYSTTGGTQLCAPSLASVAGLELFLFVGNQGATNSQSSNGYIRYLNNTIVALTQTTPAATTTGNTTFVITGTKATAGDTWTMVNCVLRMINP